MCLERNIEELSCNYFSTGTSVRITYCETVFVDLVIQHVMRMLHIVIRGLLGYKVCFHSIHKRHDFRQESY